jgi:DNA-binding NarL/FixJ family response regulator
MSTDTSKDVIKVFIVDDHPIVRQGVTMLVNHEKDMGVCGEADSAPDALEGIAKTSPHVAVVDLSLRDSSGLELIKDLRIRHPELAILVLSMRDESFYAERVFRAGAMGYIPKDEGTERVIDGIRKVHSGQMFISEKLSAKMISRFVGSKPGGGTSPADVLSDRELEVFELIGRGLTTRQVARKLHLSIKTIESHREHIKEKLQLTNATELLKYAIQWEQHHGAGGVA